MEKELENLAALKAKVEESKAGRKTAKRQYKEAAKQLRAAGETKRLAKNELEKFYRRFLPYELLDTFTAQRDLMFEEKIAGTNLALVWPLLLKTGALATADIYKAHVELVALCHDFSKSASELVDRLRDGVKESPKQDPFLGYAAETAVILKTLDHDHLLYAPYGFLHRASRALDSTPGAYNAQWVLDPLYQAEDPEEPTDNWTPFDVPGLFTKALELAVSFRKSGTAFVV